MLGLAIYAVPYVAIILPFVMIISLIIVSRAANALRESVRLNSTTKSPLLSYMGESIAGASTIRAYGKTNRFIAGNS